MNNLKEIEEKIMEFWEREKIYQKVKEKRKRGKTFYFLDGPPYATGSIHMGTALNKIIKDCYLRFLRMFGYNVWDRPGFDCHGVPIENSIEQKLNFRNKKDIEKFGVEKFIDECKKFATQYIGIMSNQFKNLGVWMDWENPYLTLTNDYIEGAWFTFKEGFKKGYLYKGVYPVHVCPHCETVVAYNEIEYTQVTDPSIYVKFPVKDKEKQFLLIWTTTPWTIPANTGIMAKPDAEYVKVKIADEILILAKDLLEKTMEKAEIKNYEIIESVKGKDLEGIKYNHPLYDLFPFQKNLTNAYRVVLSDQFVSLDEGTGLVHCAPGHGQEDFKVGMENGLPSPSPVKLDGTFTEECGPFSGMYVKNADKLIIDELRKRGLLFYEEKITHDYPLCWRCESPLIMIAVPQWFFKITEIRKDLIELNKKINWVPKWAGQRFQNWLENLGDWPISRQRYWGIPLPIWVCEKCKNIKVIGSADELPIKLSDLHKPHIDKVILDCKCGGKMKRVPDILDVWFDSGVAPWASLGYPKNKKLFKKMWPVIFITEGPDQIRGWWNSLAITSFITFGRFSFENVLFHGFVLDAHGVKMSKSKGNVVMPEEIIAKYGRDVLRFYFLSNTPWDDFYFKWEDVEKIAKSFIIVKNVFNFVKMYVEKNGKSTQLKNEDKWILSRLNAVIEHVTNNFKKYNAHEAAKEILDFIINDFSRWYVKIIRDRVWPTYEGKDKYAAFYTLLTVTENLVKILAPFCPFLAEEIYQNIVLKFKKGEESVHLSDWPKVDKKRINKKIEEDMEIVKKMVEACAAARQSAGIKLRWPIKSVYIFTENKKAISAANKLKEILLNMCNCKEIKIVKEKPQGDFAEADFNFGKILIDKELDKELLEEALVREVIRAVQQLRKENKFNVSEYIILTLNSDERTNQILKKNEKVFEKEVGAKKVYVGKLEGRYKGSIKFENVQIEIAFEKLI